MKKLTSHLLALSLLTSSSAFAVNGFEIKDIRVEGLQRISEGAVFTKLPVEVGDSFDKNLSAEVIRTLYQTGFFKDVVLKQDGDVLVIHVVERPAIADIIVDGNRELKTKELLDALKKVGLAKGQTFNRSLLAHMKKALETEYFSLGRYNTEVDVDVVSESNNRVQITIDIKEGEIARIKKINVVGNRHYSDDRLLKEFKLAPPNIFSWYTKADQYSKEKLNGDLETLRSFYLNRGYVNFKITSTQVSITPDKNDVYVTVNVSEGERYRLKDFSFSGDLLLPESELRSLVTMKPGDYFSRQKITEAATAIGKRLGDEGYAFAQVNPVPQMNNKTHEVSLTFFVNPNQRVYVRRILFKGNDRTHDSVLRRELIQMEGGWVSVKQIQDSEKRLNRTGYVQNVHVSTVPVPGTNDQVDVIYQVEEASSGTFTGGVGYSNSDGFLVQADITNRNFMGTGNHVNLQFNNSQAHTTYSFGYTNPYVTVDGLSRGFNLYYTETDLSNVSSVSHYSTDAYGGSISYGYPITKDDKFTFGGGYQKTKLSVNRDLAPTEIMDFIVANGSGYEEFTLNLGWNHNSLNSFLFPETGFKQSLGFAATVPGSDLQYYSVVYKGKWFYPLGRGYTFSSKTRIAYGDGYGDTSTLPFYKHFFIGGARTLRGFEENSLGPRDSNGRPFGGNLAVSASAALVLPNYFHPEDKTMRASLFIDAGQVYDTHDGAHSSDGLRYSVGASFTWVSPLAPLVFSFAKPLNEHTNDKTQSFTFSFGTFF